MNNSPLILRAGALAAASLALLIPSASAANRTTAPNAVSSPTVAITAQPAAQTTSPSATFAFTATNATSLTCSVDAHAYQACVSPASYSGLSTGPHSFSVRANGKTGSASAGATWTVQATTTAPVPLGVGGSWTLKFDDEFSQSALDLSRWQPNWFGATSASVTPPENRQDLNCLDPAQVTETGGILSLAAVARSCRASNGTSYRYASGLINTHNTFTFTYGYLEARIFIPADSAGVPVNFPAFWADGVGTWPASGELDVMEVLKSCGPGLGFHFHSSVGTFGGCASHMTQSGWHTFGARWQPGSVAYYYDGQSVGQVSSGITGAPMYLLLNNSIDPTYGGATLTPATMQVDYVRVWQ